MGAVYATVTALEAGWRPLDTAERERAEVLLRRASALMRAECPGLDARLASGGLDAEVAELVCCAIVQRILATPAAYEALESYSETSGPYSETGKFTNPSGNYWTTKQERKWLGCSTQRAFMVDMAPNSAYPPVGGAACGESLVW